LGKNGVANCPGTGSVINSTLYALNASTGGIVWNFNMTGQTGGGLGTGVSSTNDIVFTGDGNHTFYALNATTGSILWRQSDPNGGVRIWSWGAPAIVDGMVFETTLGSTATGTLEAYAPYLVFNENGLPLNTSWHVTFYGKMYNSTTKTLSISVFPPGTNPWNASSPISGSAGVRFVASKAHGTIQIPLFITPRNIIYRVQYNVNIAKSPKTGGSTTPGSAAWYNAGSVIALSAAPNPGYSFSRWVPSNSTNIMVSNLTSSSTTAKINGPGIILAQFHANVGLNLNSTSDAVAVGSSIGVNANVSGGPQTSTLSVTSVLPSGVNVTFAQNPVVDSATGVSVGVTISTNEAAAPGVYNITLRATGKNNAIASATYTLTVI